MLNILDKRSVFEGLMLNPLSAKAFEHYSKPFYIAFKDSLGRYTSAISHDSYEYSWADWSDDLFVKFEVNRGYSLQEFLPELMGKGKNEKEWLANSEFQKVLTELKRSEFGYGYISDLQLLNSNATGREIMLDMWPILSRT